MESLKSGIQYRHWPIDNPRPAYCSCMASLSIRGVTSVWRRALMRGALQWWAPTILGRSLPGVRCHLNRFDEYLAPLTALSTNC